MDIVRNIESKISKPKNGHIKDYLYNIRCDKSLYLTPAVPREIEGIIDILDINKSSGPNSIPVFITSNFEIFLFSLMI